MNKFFWEVSMPLKKVITELVVSQGIGQRVLTIYVVRTLLSILFLFVSLGTRAQFSSGLHLYGYEKFIYEGVEHSDSLHYEVYGIGTNQDSVLLGLKTLVFNEHNITINTLKQRSRWDPIREELVLDSKGHLIKKYEDGHLTFEADYKENGNWVERIIERGVITQTIECQRSNDSLDFRSYNSSGQIHLRGRVEFKGDSIIETLASKYDTTIFRICLNQDQRFTYMRSRDHQTNKLREEYWFYDQLGSLLSSYLLVNGRLDCFSRYYYRDKKIARVEAWSGFENELISIAYYNWY